MGRWLLVVVLALATALAVLPGQARAAAPDPAVVTVAAPAVHAGEATTVTVTVTAQGAPVVGGQVGIERNRDGGWVPVADVVTDASGRATASVTLLRDPLNNRVRATVEGTDQYGGASATLAVPLRKRDSLVTLGGPGAFKDETTATLTVRWRAVGAGPIDGQVALVRRLAGERDWRRVALLATGGDGTATIKVSPRVDSRWRVFAPPLPWVRRGRSEVHRLDNRPPVAPVVMPRGAPRPRRSVPPQRRAVGDGANARIRRIPNGVWRQMTGRSWHRGCPVGRAGLRLVSINYWDYTGYRRRGELVVAAGVAGRIAGALRDMYAAELPIRSMYRVDRFGWSERLHGADDYASMAAGNTSAFNCRDVVGRPGIRSPHSYGRSLDINPWENPYRSPQGVYPNTWWLSRSHPRIAWRSRGHQVVQIMARHGLRWTYGLNDIHHFDAVLRGGRVLRVPGCDSTVCH
ncbi:M15 family metallopeptidase [Nocardioides bizhenqiangii]|uniref:M15 family metallopeptidase n=1 Tax=Nocardioides bizhenqiangii TaxID=3095076 RepID=A0ABZ0ZVG2_9ACTN|nr:M15 family metallopeptidase [Nocardioides sp. HM61]WQQ27951.1 M15 family metallopeptidase [Nocardioides sp. HM61]